MTRPCESSDLNFFGGKKTKKKKEMFSSSRPVTNDGSSILFLAIRYRVTDEKCRVLSKKRGSPIYFEMFSTRRCDVICLNLAPPDGVIIIAQGRRCVQA